MFDIEWSLIGKAWALLLGLNLLVEIYKKLKKDFEN
jgi:hypothetical protein